MGRGGTRRAGQGKRELCKGSGTGYGARDVGEIGICVREGIFFRANRGFFERIDIEKKMQLVQMRVNEICAPRQFFVQTVFFERTYGF